MMEHYGQYISHVQFPTARFLPTWSLIKGIARDFKSLERLGGILHLKATDGGQLSTTKWVWDVVGVKDSINISCKIPTGKVLAHLGFNSDKVLPRPVTLHGWVSAPQIHSRVSQISPLILGGGGFSCMPRRRFNMLNMHLQ